jgi:AcrR family transcriptional regulator
MRKVSYGSGYRLDDTESEFRLSSPPPITPAPDRPLRADARRNRDLIVAAARKLVATHGAEVQIQDVAREAGVGVGTLYRHFRDKDALMGELMAQCMRENADIARDAGTLDDPWEAFATLVRNGCESMAADAAKRRMWNVASDEALAIAADAKAEMRAASAEVVDRARAAGALRPDFGGDDMGSLMCGLGAVIDQTRLPGDWRRLVEFALDGLRVR